jgi:hypothetical protein
VGYDNTNVFYIKEHSYVHHSSKPVWDLSGLSENLKDFMVFGPQKMTNLNDVWWGLMSYLIP